MKFRTLFFSCAIAIAFTTSVGFRSADGLYFSADYKQSGQCLTDGETEQPDCSIGNSGPVCTFTSTTGVTTAYDHLGGYTGYTCLYPYRQQ